jgi:hypothetical protein
VSVVEIATFTLAQGVTDDAFLALDRRVQTELVPNQPGFMRRTTARQGKDWVVVTLWSTEEAAADFARGVAGDPLWVEFAASMEAGSLHDARYATLD